MLEKDGNNSTAQEATRPSAIPSVKTPAESRQSVADPHSPKDAFREIVETIVFVVVLVLLLKTFVAEAFVIPTGSMAETLLGYQKWVKCSQCGYDFPVNCSIEVDPPPPGDPVPVVGCICPNCRYREIWRDRDPVNGTLRTLRQPPAWGSGDRVLVSKFPFDNNHLAQPNRFDVVVFKYPLEPQKGFTPMNYIKRLIGLPGETIAIFNGDVYVSDAVKYPDDPNARPIKDESLWEKENMHSGDDAALRAFHDKQFKILRKPPKLMMAMRRLVYDNDHQAQDLAGKVPPRWQAETGWNANDRDMPRVFRQAGKSTDTPQWLRYKHLIVERGNTRVQEIPANPQPQKIRNFMGYNAGETSDRRLEGRVIETNWVSDLMLELTVTVESAVGEFILELSQGPERFQARFDLKTGECSLWRVGTRQEELARSSNAPLKPGTHKIRFANFDSRLTLWVGDQLPFGDGVEYPPLVPDPDHPNNLEPASIGVAKGAVLSVSQIRLWRDTFYTPYTESREFGPQELRTLYVQPGHFLCLGDNSSESSDSRFWGLVPQRLMLGRALGVYYPFPRAGLIR